MLNEVPLTPRVYTLDQGYQPVDLLTYARGHLRAAEVLFGFDPHCFDSAGYIAHLSIELLIKAATLNAAGHFSGGPDLFKLLEEAPTAGVLLGVSPAEKGTLFLLYRFQEGRYPMPKDPVQIGNPDLSPIQHLGDHFLEQLDPPLRDGFLNRDPLQKGGRILMGKDREDTGKNRAQSIAV